MPSGVKRSSPSTTAEASSLDACSACAGDYEDPERTAEGEAENDGGDADDEPRQITGRASSLLREEGGREDRR